ncbi:MAG: insulinase family protein [Gomphosphaeria aponina SAG 52.96 = DSM 107014]|uniref:Insulinase family protein n=1 Tax=Gomphosphaeria aponina SAG 52.96 = DSM 107014 TaxID=1521640 RepID=A0A941GQ05_9CHRO|nr:insulinase family protein [Gomphosphaeria aponina SAG 52.96 = DSM 107014]
MTSTVVKSQKINAPTIHQLGNGLTIVAEQMPTEVVNLNVWLNVGSVVESDEINGMAHFLEHMVFKGTPKLSPGEFERIIEERGAVTNAATSQEYTQYYITTAPKDFAALAPLQLDVVLNPNIAEDAFERERLVVLEEINRAEDNPGRRTFSWAMEMGFAKLPYRRQVLGTTGVITGLTARQMREFHSQWYNPTSMTVAVVGNLPVDELIAIVAESVLNLPQLPFVKEENCFLPSAELEPELPHQEIVRREYVDESLQQARLVMMWRVPGRKNLSETYALDVLAGILGRGKMSRLFRDLREDRELVSQISVSNMTFGCQGLFYVYAKLPTENVAEVEKAIASHIATIQTAGVNNSEVVRLKTQVANRFIFGNERASDRAGLYGYYQSLLGDIESGLNYPDYIKALSPHHLQTAAQNYLSPTAYGIVVVRPA